MKNKLTQELVVALILVVLLVLLVNPFGFIMTSSFLMMAVAVLLAVFALYAAFVWREKVRDEREDLHRMFADRTAFLAGAAVLLLGIVVGSLRHALDPWLVAGLIAMLLAKAAARIWSARRR